MSDPPWRRAPSQFASDLPAGDLALRILEQLPLPVVALDRDGRLLAANGELAALLAMPADELIGQPLPGITTEQCASLLADFAAQEPSPRDGWRQLEFTAPDLQKHIFICRPAALHRKVAAVDALVGCLLPVDGQDAAKADTDRRNLFIEAVLERLPVGVAINTLDLGGQGYVNARYREIYGEWRGPEAGDLVSFLDHLCPDLDQREQIHRRLLHYIAAGKLAHSQWDDIRVEGADGKVRIVQAINTPVPEYGLLISTVHEVTEHKAIQDALRESEQRYQVMADASPVGIFQCDRHGRCRYVNRRWREITGLSDAQAREAGWLAAVHPDECQSVTENWQRAVDQVQNFRSECRFRVRQDQTIWVMVQTGPVYDDRQQLTGFIGSVTDISRQKHGEEEVRRIAYYDPLTKLPNRMFFLEQMRRGLSAARRAGRRAALLFCDLDRFKDINDSLGHDKGDLLLQQIAARLSECVRQGDTLSRFGGDEFVLLLPAVNEDRDAVMVAQKIREQLARPFDLDGTEVYTSPSIGIAFYPDDGETVNSLLKRADMAMYAAKARGRNRYQFFSEDMHKRAVERMQLEAALRQAVERRDFRLVYQPQYRLATGRLEAVEALLRWQHPEQGAIQPTRFIPLAEETGLIHTIGNWVLRTACAQAKEWLDAGFVDLRVAVNLSGRQFAEPDLPRTVLDVLAEIGLPARNLELEITETVLMHDASLAIAALETLHAAGVRLTIDDFGGGFFSLIHLKDLPVDRLKIDHRFIHGIDQDDRNVAIVAAIVGLGRDLNLEVVAEGVETAAQAAVLERLGCPLVQGFHFARPLARKAIRRKLAAAG